MNETLKNILARRSVRSFTDDPVCESSMEMVLAAACAAPSAKNVRPVRFIVLNKKEMAELAEKIEQKAPFVQGQWAIAVCADTRGYSCGLGWIEDCAAAMENMQIACVSLGLGSLWYGVYKRAPKEAQCREFLKLPEGVEILGITVMGYAASPTEPHAGIRAEEVRYGAWSE
ncbi:MAG: nitroreductase family protein [Pyramidobacter sp.]|nr:nitroreductase family protein [Pyramidobacter sp.]